MRKISLFIIFYLLVLIQTSFLIHFNLFWLGYGIVLLVIALINLTEEIHSTEGIVIAVFGGFFLDVFSQRTFGSGILLLVGLAVSIKIIKNYIQIPCISYGKILQK